MIKKFFAVISIVSVVITSIASTCFAAPSYEDSGVWHGFNGTEWYDQAHVYVYGDPYDDYYIYVGVLRGNNIYGMRRSTVLAEHESTCVSYMVTGSGGEEYYYDVIK